MVPLLHASRPVGLSLCPRLFWAVVWPGFSCGDKTANRERPEAVAPEAQRPREQRPRSKLRSRASLVYDVTAVL